MSNKDSIDPLPVIVIGIVCLLFFGTIFYAGYENRLPVYCDTIKFVR